MPIDLDAMNLDANTPGFTELAENLQGNILKGHGRDHTFNLFFKFREVNDQSRAALANLFSRMVTSFAQQLAQTAEFRKTKGPGEPFANVFLSSKGYRALGFGEAELKAAFTEDPDPFGTVQSNFLEGIHAHAAELADLDPATWEINPGNDVDFMVLLADDDQTRLAERLKDVKEALAPLATLLFTQEGIGLRDPESNEGIEHFGYVDGRSQPIYLAEDMTTEEGPIQNWDPREPLKFVLVPDQFGGNADAFGSFLVFRKLEQNVRGFKKREGELAETLELKGADEERAGALAVGRFENGSPIVLDPTDAFQPLKANDFTYAGDPNGQKCPFHAHIRKTNPRGEAGGRDAERSRRITRRGIPYGTRPEDEKPGEEPEGGVGLLFMCFQASITRQFAFMQRSWVNSESFRHPGTGQDPVMAQLEPGQAVSTQKWPPVWGGNGKPAEFAFGNFVSMLGGEFFFAPSIPFLKTLAPPAAAVAGLS